MQMNYYPHIDGLRALAVLAVIIYHLDPGWLPGGFTGVDVFFVISGYVVSASLAKRDNSTFARFTLHFYARRFVRILPALLACLLATSVASTLFIPKAWLSEANEWTGLAAFFGVSNIVLALNQDAYYSPRAEFNPFIHTWSLGVEEQFYLLFPLVFFLWVKWQGARRQAAMMLLVLLTIASMTFSWWLVQRNPNGAFYWLFSRFWELAAGALLFQVTAAMAFPLKCWPALLRQGLQWMGLALICLGMLFSDLSSFPLPWALLPVLGSVLLILGLKGSQGGLPFTILSSPLAVWVGRLSYSLYLWHWPVFALLRWTTGLETTPTQLLGVGLTLVLAAASYAWLEQPVRIAQAARRWPDRVVVPGGIVAVVVAAGISLWTFTSQTTLSLSVTSNTAQWYPHAYSVPTDQTRCELLRENNEVGGAVRQRFIPQGCETSGRRVFVLGDSHAGAYLPMLTRLVQEHGQEVWLYTQGGCAYLNLFKPMYAEDTGCATFARSAHDDILAQLRPEDVVFLPSLRLRRFGDQWNLFPLDDVQASMDGPKAREDRKHAVEEGRLDLALFVSRGARIILEAPKPIFKAPAFRCSDWFNQSNPICAPGLEVSREELLRFREPALQALEMLTRNVDGTTLWDPFELLCPNGPSCSAADEDEPLFFDGDHLTTAGNMRVYDHFVACLKSPAACDSTHARN